jgi:queuine tRNA-ribosyltransferase
VLFDVGLGAGSNAAAAFRVSAQLAPGARRLALVSFDCSLEALRVALEPRHRPAFGLEGGVAEAARELLEHGVHDGPRTRWSLQLGDLRERLPAVTPRADVVFWDPFSPAANPELWSVAIFAQLRAACRAGATVHTYSTSTRVRSALLLAGFCVGHGVCVGEKAETTMASVGLDALERPLGRRWLERLGRSSRALPDDAPEGAMERIRGLPQFAG